MAAIYVLLFFLCLAFQIATSLDNFTATLLLRDPENIASINGNFKMGFFSPPNTKTRYLGIWYNKVSAMDFVWVANRNNPIDDSTGVLRISEDGNLQVLNGRKDILWSSNVSQITSNSSRNVQLLDSGNLCLLEFNPNRTNFAKGSIIWQSFDHPTDSILPNSKLSMSSSNMKHALISWKSPSDPSNGRFSLGTDSLVHPQVIIYDGDRVYWRSGPWNGNIFLGLLYNDPTNNYADTYIEKDVEDGSVDLVYTGASNLAFSHYAFSYDGTLNEIWWDPDKRSWETIYRAPDIGCDFYGKCGAFGTCNPLKSPNCRCLKGFIPKNDEEWSRGNWSSGCLRRTQLQCGSEGSQQDGFLIQKSVKLPDFAEWFPGLSPIDCTSQCLNNCSCLAYAYDAGAGCLCWSRDLIDIQEYSSGGLDVYLRLAHSELGNKGKHKVIIAVSMIFSAVGFAIIIYILWRCMSQRKANETKRKKIMLAKNKYGDNRSQAELEELPRFEFEKLAVATNNFDEKHKLGQGGFGQVYKGRLEDGHEIAVKRLLTTSGQGLQEFMNEVVVISRLQHRNLVRLLGFCVEGEEKMLVYEYMPNKSLDTFLFDPIKQQVLDWKKRFNIIEGVCRGLLYLHRDSRLKIIHRDLKASNILLDEDLNPKISDFGMARIFGYNQDQDKTRMVVGTYGYMAPEYAMEGHFSEKSDVYSFGVLLLEIVTGKRNNTFWFKEQSLTLPGYMWNLWLEDDVVSVIDPVISDICFRKEIERCIQVGLLCVQEYVKDRPNVSTIMSMLASEITDLPCPLQPGFNKRLVAFNTLTESSQLQELSYAPSDISSAYFSGR